MRVGVKFGLKKKTKNFRDAGSLPACRRSVFKALFVMSGGIYVCNMQNTENRDVKTRKKLKRKIRKLYGTGLDF